MEWMSKLLEGLGHEQWSVNAMVRVMIDNCLSFGDLQKFRQALSLKYSREHDRYMHPVWFVPECDSHLVRPRFLRLPEPVPPIYESLKAEFRKYQDKLQIEISEDGKCASHSFEAKIIELHEEHLAAGMLCEGVGTSSPTPSTPSPSRASPSSTPSSSRAA